MGRDVKVEKKGHQESQGGDLKQSHFEVGEDPAAAHVHYSEKEGRKARKAIVL